MKSAVNDRNCYILQTSPPHQDKATVSKLSGLLIDRDRKKDHGGDYSAPLPQYIRERAGTLIRGESMNCPFPRKIRSSSVRRELNAAIVGGEGTRGKGARAGGPTGSKVRINS